MNEKDELFHIDHKGRAVPLSSIGSRHLLNIIIKINKDAVKGLLIEVNANEEYVGKVLYGEELKQAMNINKYKKALIKRIVDM